MRFHERVILLNVIDQQWKDHLLSMDHLKEGIGLRGYGQRDPLTEYKRESFELFRGMTERIEDESVRYLFLLEPVSPEQEQEQEKKKQEVRQRQMIFSASRLRRRGRPPPCRRRRWGATRRALQRSQIQALPRSVSMSRVPFREELPGALGGRSRSAK
jgi:preprotein translocase subunit SecA